MIRFRKIQKKIVNLRGDDFLLHSTSILRRLILPCFDETHYNKNNPALELL